MKGEPTRRDCTCKIAKHQHGTRQAYVIDKCRCDGCRQANSAWSRQKRRAKAYGRYDDPMTDAASVRERILWLRQHGVSDKTLAKLTGIPLSSIGRIVNGRTERGEGPAKRILKANADKIMAVRPTLDIIAASRLIDGTGTRRRIQALAAIGYSISHQAHLLGRQQTAHNRTLHADEVYAATAREMSGLYEQLWDKPYQGQDHRTRISASRSRNHAARNGWAVPMAWDNIDNRRERPKGTESSDAA